MAALSRQKEDKVNVSQVIWVALGGALGAVSRFWLSSWVNQRYAGNFPLGTLSVNLLGSMLFGFLFVIIFSLSVHREPLRLAVLVGFMGAFTTFSTFSFETMRLIQEHAIGLAVLNICSSCLLCVLGCWIGDWVAKALF